MGASQVCARGRRDASRTNVNVTECRQVREAAKRKSHSAHHAERSELELFEAAIAICHGQTPTSAARLRRLAAAGGRPTAPRAASTKASRLRCLPRHRRPRDGLACSDSSRAAIRRCSSAIALHPNAAFAFIFASPPAPSTSPPPSKPSPSASRTSSAGRSIDFAIKMDGKALLHLLAPFTAITAPPFRIVNSRVHPC